MPTLTAHPPLQKAWTAGSSLSAAWRSSSSAAPAPEPPPSAPCPAEKQAEGPNWAAAPWYKRSAWGAAAGRKDGLCLVEGLAELDGGMLAAAQPGCTVQRI